MKTIVLAGGLGTRLAEETQVRPKPMLEIGGRPVLWHIMKIYSHFGFDEFAIALGYKGEMIKQYFLDYARTKCDFTLETGSGRVKQRNEPLDDWTVHLVDTGQNTMTGGRIKRLQHLVGDETFLVTYGDGLADVDLDALMQFHRSHGRLATVTAVRPPARFGGLNIADGRVESFSEKPQTGEGWINGGFFVFEPEVLDLISDDSTILEREPLERLSRDGQLMAFRHEGFWQCMDTLRERRILEELWASDSPPWKVWPDEPAISLSLGRRAA